MYARFSSIQFVQLIRTPSFSGNSIQIVQLKLKLFNFVRIIGNYMVMSLVIIDNQIFRVGRNISEKFVMGGTNFRGVQIKRDISWSVLSIFSLQCHLILTPILSPLPFMEWLVTCHNLGEGGGLVNQEELPGPWVFVLKHADVDGLIATSLESKNCPGSCDSRVWGGRDWGQWFASD